MMFGQLLQTYRALNYINMSCGPRDTLRYGRPESDI